MVLFTYPDGDRTNGTWQIDGVEVPQPVVQAIKAKFMPNAKLFQRIMYSLRHDRLNNCYFFSYADMYHGVEPDGYIHT